MSELELIKIYTIGRNRGFLPNTDKLNSFIYDELINKCKEEDLDAWYLIYSQYSTSGILEKCFQCNLNCFSWYDTKLLMDSTRKFKTMKKINGRYLRNKRSKY